MLEHPNEDLLLTYALDRSLVVTAGALEAHLDGCAPCRQRLAEIREDDALLKEADSWPDADEVAPLDVTALRVARELRAAWERRRREDAEADRLLGTLVKGFVDGSSGAFVWADFASKRQYHTAGVVRKLAAAADKAQYSAPLRALFLAERASAIVDMLSTATYMEPEITSLRGLCWKQRANANRHLGRFTAALEALDQAERAYREVPRPELDLGSLTFIRATVYFEQQMYDLAQEYATQSTAMFALLRQTELYFRSHHLQGCIAFEQRRLGDAQSIFDEVFAYGETSGDASWIARASLELGHCHLERRELSSATQCFHRGMIAFRNLGLLSGENRCRWGLALVVQRDGSHRMAVSRLKEVRAEFEKLGAVSDAALVALDIMETLLLLERPREVRQTAANIVQLFIDAGMFTGAITAAGYLKQAATMSNITPGLIDYVRKYLRRVDLQPDLVFVPPATL